MNLKNGFTLVEILIALCVGMIILAAVYGVVNLAQKSSSGIKGRVIAQKDVRGALQIMALELRMASYNKSLNISWVDPSNCTSLSLNQSFKGIQYADPFNITVEMDLNDSNVIGDGPNEIITYSYDTINQRITRSSNCGTPFSFIGDTVASGNPRLVTIVNDLNNNNTYDPGIDVPVFRYFDINNNEILPVTLMTSMGIPLIRSIEITLVADTESINQMTNSKQRIVYSTLVALRNHGINP